MVKCLDFSGKLMVACVTVSKSLGSVSACWMELSGTKGSYRPGQGLPLTWSKHVLFELLCRDPDG